MWPVEFDWRSYSLGGKTRHIYYCLAWSVKALIVLAVVHPARMAFMCCCAACGGLSVCHCKGRPLVIIVNSKLIFMHIKYYVWGGIVVTVFVCR